MGILQDIFTYPFRGSGKYMLLFGVILSVISKIASFAPAVGSIAGLILAAYLTATYFEIIETTATGSDKAPVFPNVTSVWDDLIWPLLKSVIVALFSFAPLWIYLICSGENNARPEWVLALAGLGAIYFPMAMTAMVVLGYLGAMLPHIVVPAIFRAGGLYWLAVFLIILIFLAQGFLGDLLARIPILGAVVASLVEIVAMMINGRTLGIIYRERREEMGWI